MRGQTSNKKSTTNAAATSAAPATPTAPAAPAAPTDAAIISSKPANENPDVFTNLTVVTPVDKLTPIDSVRVRDEREAQERSRQGTIRIIINTTPKYAQVFYGGKLLGETPLTLEAQRGSTPLDIVIRHKQFMTLRTRIQRKVTRTYAFTLTPAKL